MNKLFKPFSKKTTFQSVGAKLGKAVKSTPKTIAGKIGAKGVKSTPKNIVGKVGAKAVNGAKPALKKIGSSLGVKGWK